MKKVNFLVLVASILLVSCYTSSKKYPVLTFNSDTITFAPLQVGDSIQLSAGIQNTGSDTLKITNIGYSCDCTNGYLDKKNLPPGDSTKLHLIYKSSKEPGTVMRTVVVESNDTAIVSILRITGRIMPLQ